MEILWSNRRKGKEKFHVKSIYYLLSSKVTMYDLKRINLKSLIFCTVSFADIKHCALFFRLGPLRHDIYPLRTTSLLSFIRNDCTCSRAKS